VLVISRKSEQSVVLGSDIIVTILSIEGDRVTLGIRAPRSVVVLRQELYDKLHAASSAT
jgi:carbon storage regulator